MTQIIVKQKANVTIAQAGEKLADGSIRAQDWVIALIAGVNEVPPEALDHPYVQALIKAAASTANTNVEVARRRYEGLQKAADEAKIEWENLVAMSKPIEVVKAAPRNKTPEEIRAEEAKIEEARKIEEKRVADEAAAKTKNGKK